LALSRRYIAATALAVFIVFLFALVDSVAFSGAAPAETDDLKGASPSDVSEWRYHGIDAEESRRWINAGIIFAAWAAQWRGEGFSAEAAGQWRGIANVYTAGDFLRNGFGPDEAKEWMDHGIRSGMRAREYQSIGLTAKEAGSFWSAGLYPDEIKEWRNAGFDAGAMLQWRYGPRENEFFYTKDSPSGRAVYSLQQVIPWRDAGFTPQEAQRAGIYGIALGEAKQWKDAGFSFNESVQWRDSGFTVKEAVLNRGSGMSAVDAELRRYDQADSRGDEITNLESDITVNSDGTLDVIETIAIIDRPGGAYVNGFSRPVLGTVLRSPRSSGFSKTIHAGPGFHVRSIELDGMAGDHDISDGILRFRKENAPLAEGEHLIKIAYTTDGWILDKPHHDELSFAVVEDTKGRYIRNASVTVRLPKGADVIFADGLAGLHQRKDLLWNVEESEHGDRVHFTTTRPLRDGMVFSVTVAFIKGYVSQSIPRKLVQLDLRTGRFLSSLAVFLTGFALLFVYYLVAWLKVGRDPKSRVAAGTEFSVPDDMDPACMRALSAKGKTDHVSVVAELLYLAELGFIKIFESEGSYKIEKTQLDPANLPLSAREFYGSFFSRQNKVILTRRGRSSEVALAGHVLKTLLKNEYKKHTLSNLRYLWPGIIIAVLFAGASLAVIDYAWLQDRRNAGALLAGYAVFLAAAFGLLSLLFMRLLRSSTKEYAILRERLIGHAAFLQRSYAGIGAPFIPPFLQEHLAYAIAAGVDVRDLLIRGGEAKWYQGASGGFGCGDFITAIKRSL
jgi:hypothetical protein